MSNYKSKFVLKTKAGATLQTFDYAGESPEKQDVVRERARSTALRAKVYWETNAPWVIGEDQLVIVEA